MTLENNVRFYKRSGSDTVLKHLKNTDLVQLPQPNSGEALPGEKSVLKSTLMASDSYFMITPVKVIYTCGNTSKH